MSGLQVSAGHDYLAGESSRELAEALATLLTDPTLAAQLAANGRRYVNQHHDWQAAASQLEAVYRQLPHKDNLACA